MSTTKGTTKSHKYRTGYQYIELQTPHETYTVRLKEHAAKRWDERTPSWSMSTEDALRASKACVWLNMDAFESPVHKTIPDMVHYVAECDTERVEEWDDVDDDIELDHDEPESYEALFIEKEDKIKTVYIRDFIDDESKDAVHGYLDVLKEGYNGV